ncbi:hypothetical protein BC937DRAFT_94168 [Endogone sp. FLAS-F59071]|nr:hypothetical protein BC937DRAFT_94168 [Endogone sp. FLAS-F59071]|eukprot:RUS14220.1 hypothetical protein BC937DRAFT_94168 [Endogone sp. FLAS-F59071]
MAVSIAYSSIQPNGTVRSDFTDEDDDVSLAAFLTPSWRFDQEKLTYDVLANQQSGVSVNPDWASLYTDPSVDKPTRPHIRTRTSSNSSKDSSRPLTPVGQSHPQHNGSAKITSSKPPASSSITASTLPSSLRSHQSTAASEASLRRVSAAAASPLSKATSFPATIASPNGVSSSIQSPQRNSNGDVSAFGDELAHNFLHPKYQEQRRGSITSVKSDMSTKSLSGKLSFSKRLRRVLSMNNMKDNDTESIREPSDESIRSTVSESSNPSLRFIRNRNTRFSQLNCSSVLSSTSPVLSNQQYDDDTASESHITTSVNSGGSRASMPPPRPGTPQPMISRRRSLVNLGSLFSRNQAGQANLEEEHVVSDTSSLAPKVVPQSTNDKGFASMVKRRHSSGDLKFLASERETERDSINQVESKKIISKDDSSAGRSNSGTAVKDRPSMLRHDSLEGRDRVRGILKVPKSSLMTSTDSPPAAIVSGNSRLAGSSVPNRFHIISSYDEPTQQRDSLAQSNAFKQRPQSQSLSSANVLDEPQVREVSVEQVVQLTELQSFPVGHDSVSSYPSSMSNSPVHTKYLSTTADEFSQDHPPLYSLFPRPELSTSTESARRSNTAPNTPTLPKSIRTPRLQRSLQFAPNIQIHETHASGDYDRRCDANVTCAKLTPLIAMKIKQELNEYKLKEMDVHIDSRIYTHFFL